MIASTTKEFAEKNYDVCYFVSGPKETAILQGNYYVEDKEFIESSSLGLKYHIVIFKEDEKGNLYDADKFEAILIAPVEYMSRMIKNGWFSIVAKKTSDSHKFIEDLFDNLKEV
jgi:hypothetical protein